jgi:hypothetical protein
MTEQIGTEITMAYTLDEFCAESRALLKAEPQANALAQISQRLGRLLSNPSFVAETFSDATPPGRRVLYHDPETDFYVLAHVQEGKKIGKPHRRRERRSRGSCRTAARRLFPLPADRVVTGNHVLRRSGGPRQQF